MRYFLISDNTETQTGMRLAGIEGVVLHDRQEVISAIEKVLADRSIGILLITEKLASLCPEMIYDLKLNRHMPLVVEIPDRHGTGRTADSITRYVREAIGIKI
ncbi:MAG: V-type ATP synthase subunit F [Bacillota bacterium]|nr:V-type ATP synthase subunit F [Bacillota bacterium]